MFSINLAFLKNFFFPISKKRREKVLGELVTLRWKMEEYLEFSKSIPKSIEESSDLEFKTLIKICETSSEVQDRGIISSFLKYLEARNCGRYSSEINNFYLLLNHISRAGRNSVLNESGFREEITSELIFLGGKNGAARRSLATWFLIGNHPEKKIVHREAKNLINTFSKGIIEHINSLQSSSLFS